jgi:hypothetical protein
MLTPSIRATTKKTTKTKKIIFAMEAAPAAISVNPKIEAMIAMTKNINDHLSIIEIGLI